MNWQQIWHSLFLHIIVWNTSFLSNIWNTSLVFSVRNTILGSSLARACVVGVCTRWQRRSSLTNTFGCQAKFGYSPGPPAVLALDSATNRAPGFLFKLFGTRVSDNLLICLSSASRHTLATMDCCIPPKPKWNLLSFAAMTTAVFPSFDRHNGHYCRCSWYDC